MAHGPAPRNLRHDPPVSAHATERFLVCLPTYNERENLERMIAAIDAARGRAAIPGDVLVIDDGSPDGTGDVAANLLITFERDDQVAFAPAIKTGIRELVATPSAKPMVSLEDVGGREIHVRPGTDHLASLQRLNGQLKGINRPQAKIVIDRTHKTDEDLLDAVNAGRIPSTLIDDYIFDRWKATLPSTTVNRDIAVSQDGALSWVSRKDAPQLVVFLKDFFSTHRVAF